MFRPPSIIRPEPRGSALLVSLVLLVRRAQQGGSPSRSLEEASVAENLPSGLRISIRSLKEEGEDLVILVCLRHLRKRNGELVRGGPFERPWSSLGIAYSNAGQTEPEVIWTEILHHPDFYYHQKRHQATYPVKVPLPRGARWIAVRFGRLSTHPVSISRYLDCKPHRSADE